MTHIKYDFIPTLTDLGRFLMPSVMPHDCCSFKIHATSRQLHEWTRTEKTKAKERAPQMVKEEQADLFSEEPPATKSETFEGEMDNFQTPLVRRSHMPFFYVRPINRSADVTCPAQQPHSLGRCFSLGDCVVYLVQPRLTFGFIEYAGRSAGLIFV